MNKIWYILIESKREGPYSFEDLKSDGRITPDTLVWKEGFDGWKKIGDVIELKELFRDEAGGKKDEEVEDAEVVGVSKPAEGELTMDMRQEPPYLLWILVALASLLYVILQLQR